MTQATALRGRSRYVFVQKPARAAPNRRLDGKL